MDLCKIRVSIPGKLLAIEMPRDEAEVWFGTLCDALLNPQMENEEDEEDDEEEPEKTEDNSMKNEKQKTGVKGFLMIRCAACGMVKGYHAKTYINQHICPGCGERASLLPLKMMYAKCECGAYWKYRTNLTDHLTEISCIHCGRPITMEQNRDGAYNTI